jgi:hypothetical protein
MRTWVYPREYLPFQNSSFWASYNPCILHASEYECAKMLDIKLQVLLAFTILMQILIPRLDTVTEWISIGSQHESCY